VETGRPLDFALYGKGFFVIETPDGLLYTRNGIFHINQNGQMVNSNGNIVLGQIGPIAIPDNTGLSELYVSADGSVSARGTIIDKLKLVNFKDSENKLIPVGANCYSVSGLSEGGENVKPIAAENIVVKQGYQEASNVQIVDELVDMIMVSRLYEANMNLISSQKDTSSSIIGVAMA
jgi:flagellar basal-body rod protein FlgG